MNALMACMSTPANIKLPNLIAKADANSKAGKIDSTTNLKDSKVFIFAGTQDTTVKPDVGRKGEEMYEHYGADITTEYGLAAVHAQPTEDKSLLSCTLAGSPYI